MELVQPPELRRARLLQRFAAHPERLFASPFELVKPRLEGSAVFRSLERMPKGGLLHIHATGTGDSEWLVDHALADPGCYVYWGETTDAYCHGQLAAFPNGDIPEGFVPIADLARTEPHLRAQLIDLFTLGAEDATVTDIWQEFEDMFWRIDGYVSYVPVFRGYYRDAFLDMARDGIRFVELRTGLDPLTAADGSPVEDESILQEYRSILASVRQSYPGFDLRIIVCTWRGATLEQAAAQLDRERSLAAVAPDLIAGFDVIAQEDTGHRATASTARCSPASRWCRCSCTPARARRRTTTTSRRPSTSARSASATASTWTSSPVSRTRSARPA